MKKIKFFTSLYRERDWLEEMAMQGFFLADVSMGFLYHFEKGEPAEKVYEIERFSISSQPQVAELDARITAIERATQAGWQVVTHDEDMNYYFVKDKAGDETDEFYDETARIHRAERLHKRYSNEAPLGLLVEWLVISVFCMLILLLMLPILKDIDPAVPVIFGLIYVVTTITEIGSAFFNLTWGHRAHDELRLSRKEWEHRKKYSFRKRFSKIHQLQSFLKEQSDAGFALTGIENGKYLFAEDSEKYDYFVETKACLKKRLVHQDIPINSPYLKWYETSMADAAVYDLKPLGIVMKNAIIYRRPHSDKPLPPENENSSLNRQTRSLVGVALIAGALVLGAVIGILITHMNL